MKNFYIPIKSTSLAHYFSKASIYPTKYISDRIEDIQNKYDSFILIADKKWTENTDCSLEIVLIDEEIKKVKEISKNFGLLDIPIPITRIRNIYFTDKEQKDTTIWNINSGAAFVSSELLILERKEKKDIADEQELNNINADFTVRDLSEKIKKYDKILGGFALMQLGGKSYMNYSPNFFDTLSYFNVKIEEEIKRVKRKINDKFFGLFNKNSKDWDKITAYIGENLTVEEIKKIADDEKIHLEEKYGLIDFELINPKSYLYLLSIFATYGDRKRKSVDDFISLILSDKFSMERKEGLVLLFGMNNGYANFRNKYKIKGIEKDVKFRLNSQLDYYIIESIYKYVFNNKTDNVEFNYIDEWCLKQRTKSIKGYKTFRILDKVVITKKKHTVGSPEYLQELLQEYTLNELYSRIANLVIGWLPAFMKTKEYNHDGPQYFKNELKTDLEKYLTMLIKKVVSDNKEEIVEVQAINTEKLNEEKNELCEKVKKLKGKNKTLQNKVSQYERKLTALIKENELQRSASQIQHRAEINGLDTTTQISSEKDSKTKIVVNEPKYDFSENQEGDSLAELNKLNMKVLKERAKKIGIRGLNKYKKDNKAELIEKIIKKTEEENLGFN